MPGAGGQYSHKEGDPKASGEEIIDHTPITVNHSNFESATHETGSGYCTRFDEYSFLKKLYFHVALEEVRVTELLGYPTVAHSGSILPFSRFHLVAGSGKLEARCLKFPTSGILFSTISLLPASI